MHSKYRQVSYAFYHTVLPRNVKRSEDDYLSLSLGKRIYLQVSGSHSLIYESHLPPNSSQKHHESIWCPSVTFCI